MPLHPAAEPPTDRADSPRARRARAVARRTLGLARDAENAESRSIPSCVSAARTRLCSARISAAGPGSAAVNGRKTCSSSRSRWRMRSSSNFFHGWRSSSVSRSKLSSTMSANDRCKCAWPSASVSAIESSRFRTACEVLCMIDPGALPVPGCELREDRSLRLPDNRNAKDGRKICGTGGMTRKLGVGSAADRLLPPSAAARERRRTCGTLGASGRAKWQPQL